MIFSWLKRRRRQRLRGSAFPAEHLDILRRNVRHFELVPEQNQERLLELVKIFTAEKYWEGCGGLEMTDEVRLTVAAQACILLLGTEGDYCFDGVKSVLVYPHAYVQAPTWETDDLVIDSKPVTFGESWHRGPIVLSWAHVLEGSRNYDHGRNLVLHEFAHHLDGLEGFVDGIPPLADREQREQWKKVTNREYRRLVHQARQGGATLLDTYGATNRAEFFAVTTECFFQLPQEMRYEHPQLYEVLKGFYCLDPAQWS